MTRIFRMDLFTGSKSLEAEIFGLMFVSYSNDFNHIIIFIIINCTTSCNVYILLHDLIMRIVLLRIK